MLNFFNKKDGRMEKVEGFLNDNKETLSELAVDMTKCCKDFMDENFIGRSDFEKAAIMTMIKEMSVDMLQQTMAFNFTKEQRVKMLDLQKELVTQILPRVETLASKMKGI